MVVENDGYPSDSRVRAEALALTAAGDDVTVMITGFVGDTVKVGIIAPREVRVDRLEVKAAREHGARKGEPRDRV